MMAVRTCDSSAFYFSEFFATKKEKSLESGRGEEGTGQMSEQKQKTPPALARALTLARRAEFDLKLLADAGLAAEVPFAQLARIRRASRELKDLLRDLSAQNSPHEQATIGHDGVNDR